MPNRPKPGFFFVPRVTASDGQRPTSGDNPVDSVDNAVTVRPTSDQNPANSGDTSTRAGVDQSETGAPATEGNRPQPRGSDLARAALRTTTEHDAPMIHVRARAAMAEIMELLS